MKRREWVALSLGAAVAAAQATARAQSQSPAPDAIDWPPLELLGGGAIEPSDWEGQFSVLVLWATWCPFCKRHNAHVDKLYRATRGRPLRVLGVAEDRDPQLVRRYMQANGYAFPVAVDTIGLQRRLTPRKSIPMTCIIDRQGRLVQAIAGEMFEEDVLALAKLADRAGT
ncbi:MAG: TlpA disulfide reductase family protein [Burkholderiales bacterium]